MAGGEDIDTDLDKSATKDKRLKNKDIFIEVKVTNNVVNHLLGNKFS